MTDKSILVIDDNKAWQRVFREIIKDIPHISSCYFAETGEKGLDKYIELYLDFNDPTLILCDIRLGDRDGRDIAKIIRWIDPDVNLCFFTFFLEDAIGKNLGFPLISKQINIDELIIALKSALRGEHVV